MLVELDDLDRRILAKLQFDASLTTSALAEIVGVSQSVCWRRIQRLEQEGVIRANVILLDREKIGLSTHVFAQVKLSAHGRKNISEFSEEIRKFQEVLECYVLMGSYDFLLKIVSRDIHSYERFFFDKLSALPSVQEVNSIVALSEIKSTTALPISTGVGL